MKQKILIVEDEFIVANNLRLILSKANYEVCGIAASVQEAKDLVDKSKPAWVLLDIFLQDSQGTDLAEYLTGRGIAFIYISANTNQSILEKAKATHPYGFLVKPFRERDLLMMLDIAEEKHQHNKQVQRQQELLLQKQLELITHSALSEIDKWNQIPGIFQAVVPFDLMRISAEKKIAQGWDDLTFIRTGFDEYQLLKKQEMVVQLGMAWKETGDFRGGPILGKLQKICNGNDYVELTEFSPCEKALENKYRLESKLSFSTEQRYNDPVSFSFYNRKPGIYSILHLNILNKAANSLSQLLGNLYQSNSSDSSKKVFAEQNNVRIEKGQNNKSLPGFEGIIGKSPALISTLDKVSMVAPTQSSVLILGESGTGKERIAQCIHILSPRKSKPIITINCAALPKELIESELFGHERGAFTGALEKRSGKFELADGGTIFLDEIGELPLDAQVKLLRVLQEREIEHVGGSTRIKVDVRIIAATNRKLEKEVAEGRFRLDLYYRLNVFPIELPPLRDRKSDIPMLADFFIEKFCSQMGKLRPALGSNALQQLESHNWPGNIRELEHLLERSILLNTDVVIDHISLPAQGKTHVSSHTNLENQLKTLEEIEAGHILSVLKLCKGKIGGTGGAAEILGLPTSTLNSKIKKLGIKRESYFNQ